MLLVTRNLTLISALSALALNAYAIRVNVPSMPVMCVAAFVGALLLARARPRLATRIVLFVVYLSPVLFLLVKGNNHYAYSVLWIAALLGIVAAVRPAHAWTLPAHWRWPIVTWSLMVALSWPVVAWRELDFTFPLVWDPRLPVASAKLSAPGSATWTAFVALTHLLGLLWVDCLFRMYGNDRRDREPAVVWPLASAVLIACAVGTYQGFVDISFLSGHVWPTVSRAAGTLMDGNVFGMLAAMWAPAFLVLALDGGAARRAFVLLGFALAWLGVWTSGSRTALLAALIGTLFIMPMVRRLFSTARLGWRWKAALAGAAICVIAVAAFVPSVSNTAIERTRHLVPGLSLASIARTSRVLFWNRDGFGTAANAMVADHPVKGVGVGTAHILMHDYAREVAGVDIPADNAQNWFRHQLAELGLLGSVGWIVWAVVLTAAFVRVSGTAGPGAALRGPLIGLGVASLLGMPGQDPAVIITFWTFVFWFQRDSGATHPASSGWSRIGAVALVVLVGGYVWLRAVPDDLRPPFRAARFNFPYAYGMDFESPTQAWTAKHGVTVQNATAEWMKLTVWVNHPDADRNPVNVDVWKDHEHVINQPVFLHQRVTHYVHVGAGKRFVLESKVDRTFRPSAAGNSTDDRELGMALSWEFVQQPPK